MSEEQRFPGGVTETTKLIEKYLDGDITQEELALLETWKNESAANKDLFNRLTTKESLYALVKEYHAVKKTAPDAKKRANEMVFGTGAVIRPISSVIKRLSVAAAVLLIIAAGAYFWLSRIGEKEMVTVEETKTPETNDVLPGTYKARLTLADGRTIVLDSAAIGQLTKQGSSQVLNKDGGLVYSPATGKTNEVIYNTLTTAKGEMYSLTLSDGTRLWLNSGSSIRYPVVFNNATRSVALTGEAYFEVASLPGKDNKHKVPFIVQVNGREIVRVLGTEFNINAYTDEGAITTTLLEGSVRVSSAAGGSVIMKPGEQTKLLNQHQHIEKIEEADVEQAVAWKNGYFQFSGEGLRTIMRQLERWYDVEVIYEGNVPDGRYAGKIPRNAKASRVLNMLEQSGIHFRIEGKKIIVTP